jgi:hypothetical protein
MNRPRFLDNPRAWNVTQRQAIDPLRSYALSVYRANFFERLYWRWLSR